MTWNSIDVVFSMYLNYCAYHRVMLYYTVDLFIILIQVYTLTTTLNFVESKLDINYHNNGCTCMTSYRCWVCFSHVPRVHGVMYCT